MQEQLSSKSVSLVFGIIVLTLVIGFYILAWTEPTQTPPGCTSGQPGCDAPVNVGSATQTKEGALILNNILGLADGLTVSQGGVGISNFRLAPTGVLNELGVYDSGGNLIIILDQGS